MGETVVIGVGNPWRGDDGAGIAVARLVAASAPPEVTVLELRGDPAALLAAWQGASTALIIDAVASVSVPGAFHRFDATARPLPALLGSLSTHGVGLVEAIELGRTLTRMPAQLVVFCIEGQDFSSGEGLTAPVERAVGHAAQAVLAELCVRTAAPQGASAGAAPGSAGSPSVSQS